MAGNGGDQHSADDVKALVAALSDRGAYKDAQKALVKIGEPAVDPLIEALESTNEDVLWWAARSLGSIGDQRALEPLIKLHENPPSPRIRTAAGLALGNLGDPHAIPTLVQQLVAANFINEVKSMLVGFGPDAVDHIIAFLQERKALGYASGVGTGIEVLGNIGDPRAETILRDFASSREYADKKSLALEALSKLSLKIQLSQDEIEELTGMLLSSDYDVRKTALEQARTVSDSIDDPKFQRAFQASEKVKLAYDIQDQARANTKPAQACLEAIELAPQFTDAYICLAYLNRLYTDEIRTALKWANKAIEIDPTNYHAWIEMGMVQITLGDVPKAVQAFHQAISIEPSPKNLEPYSRLVAVYRKLDLKQNLEGALSAISSRGVGLDPKLEREWERMVRKTSKELLQKAIEGTL